MRVQFIKDPDNSLDYVWDWADWLGASETITTSTWIVQSGITQGAISNTTTTATTWLSGGTAGNSYTVTNRIITNQGRIADRTATVRVMEQ